MTRYDNLCKASEIGLVNFFAHRDRVFDFLKSRFLPGLLQFLECSEDQLFLFDPDMLHASDGFFKRRVLSEVMRPDAECYWNIGIVIRLERQDGGGPMEEIPHIIRCLRACSNLGAFRAF